MFEQPDKETAGTNVGLRMFGGVVAGLAASTLAIVLVLAGVMALLSGLDPTRPSMMAVSQAMDLLLLGLGGYLAYQKMRDSPFARGMLIGISIVFLLNAICGVALVVARR